MSRRNIILLAIAAAFALLVYFIASGGQQMVVSAPAVVPVVATPVVRESVPVYARSVGRVQTQHSVEVRPQIEAILMQILVQEGQAVERGTELARLDDRHIQAAIEQSRAQRAVVQAQLELAELELKRYQDLRNKRAISEQEIDRQQAQVRQLQASLLNLEAAIEADKVQLSYTRLFSPLTGLVGMRNRHEGNLVRPGDTEPLFSVVQLDPVDVEFSLPQHLLPQLQQLIRADDKAQVLVYAGDGGELLAEGRLQVMDNRVTRNSGTVRLKAAVSNPDGRLWPEQAVVVALQLAAFNEALVVPPHAVRQGADHSFVWRIQGDKAESVRINVLHSDQQLAVIDGVALGDSVVVDGYSRLVNGSTVRLHEPAQRSSGE